MKERPILFSGEMVRAILEGRKTQTRRIVKYIPALGEPENWCGRHLMSTFKEIAGDFKTYCPHGKIGDHLWVRETWSAAKKFDCLSPNEITTKSPLWFAAGGVNVGDNNICFNEKGKNRPSIHMPRWASRITLEVTGVRIDRLQDISKSDAISEGVKPCGDESHHEIPFGCSCEVDRFKSLWDSINANKAPWESNPFVWVIEFKVVKK